MGAPYNPNDRPAGLGTFRNPSRPPRPAPPWRWDNIRAIRDDGRTARMLDRVTIELHPPDRRRTFKNEPFTTWFTGIKD